MYAKEGCGVKGSMALVDGGELGDEKLIRSVDCSTVSCRASKGGNVDWAFAFMVLFEEEGMFVLLWCRAGGEMRKERLFLFRGRNFIQVVVGGVPSPGMC
jgi:hypothetical protein